jgi:2-phospho-L-lactate guanylyltransferase (CobY/MobA/RfbA family)
LVASLAQLSVVIAPDQNRRGIGALACTLPAPLRMQLGNRDSLARTLDQARAKRLRVSLVNNPHLAHDIDTVADLAQTKPLRDLLPPR